MGISCFICLQVSFPCKEYEDCNGSYVTDEPTVNVTIKEDQKGALNEVGEKITRRGTIVKQ